MIPPVSRIDAYIQWAHQQMSTWPSGECKHCRQPIYYTDGQWYHENGLRKCKSEELRTVAMPIRKPNVR